MTVVLNEVKQAENIIKNGDIGSKPASTLFLLGKYYRQKEGLNKKETFDKLNEFMSKNYKNYNPALWENIIENISDKAKNFEIREIDSVGITRQELDKISELNNIKYKKLLFTMLCYAKLYLAISQKNNGWVNTDIKEIFRAAKVSVKHRNDKFLYLNDIEKTELISFSNRNDNLNIKVNFIDMDGETVFNVEDFRELGYEYLNYTGSGNFIRCCECNRLVSKNGKNSKYCLECKTKKRLETKRKWWSENN